MEDVGRLAQVAPGGSLSRKFQPRQLSIPRSPWGDGGDGLMSGGHGASLTSGTIKPNNALGISTALGVVSTTHIAWIELDPLNPFELISTIGKAYSLDFNGDGFF